MFAGNRKAISGVVIVFFILILAIAALIVTFSFTSQSEPGRELISPPSTQVPSVEETTGLAAPGASNVPVQEIKQCTESCDDGDPCTEDFCNTLYGLCDHEFIPGCSAQAGQEEVVLVNPAPVDWCLPNELDVTLLPPYINQVESVLSAGKANIDLTLVNPSEFIAKNVIVELLPSVGFDLETGSKKVVVGDISKYDIKTITWTFKKQTNAVIGPSNPTHLKVTYSLDDKNAVLCTEVVFNE